MAGVLKLRNASPYCNRMTQLGDKPDGTWTRFGVRIARWFQLLRSVRQPDGRHASAICLGTHGGELLYRTSVQLFALFDALSWRTRSTQQPHLLRGPWRTSSTLTSAQIDTPHCCELYFVTCEESSGGSLPRHPRIVRRAARLISRPQWDWSSGASTAWQGSQELSGLSDGGVDSVHGSRRGCQCCGRFRLSVTLSHTHKVRSCSSTLHRRVQGDIGLLLLAVLGGRGVLVVSVELYVSAQVDDGHVQDETDRERN